MTKEVLDVSSLGGQIILHTLYVLCIEWPSYPFNVGTVTTKIKKKTNQTKTSTTLLSIEYRQSLYMLHVLYMTNVHASQNCKHGLAVFIITMTGKLIHLHV